MVVGVADMQAFTTSTLRGLKRSPIIIKPPETDTRCNGGGRMPTKSFPHLFKPLTLDGLRLKNRITMAPLYLGYAGEGARSRR
jgi:hypothetical protein